MGPITPIQRSLAAPIEPVEKNNSSPRVEKKKGLDSSYYKDTVRSMAEEAPPAESEESTSSKKKPAKASSSKPTVGEKIVSWFQMLWNSFLGLFGINSKKKDGVDDVGGINPKLEDPQSVEYAQMQQLIQEMIALNPKNEGANAEEKEGAVQEGDILSLVINVLNRHRKLQEEKWEVSQIHTAAHLDDLRALKKEYNEQLDKYITNNKWLVVANWVNRGMIVASLLLLGVNIALGAFTGGVTTAMAAALLALNIAAALASGSAQMTSAVLGFQNRKFTGDLHLNKHFRDETMNKIVQNSQQEAMAANQAVHQIIVDEKQILKNHRRATQAAAAA